MNKIKTMTIFILLISSLCVFAQETSSADEAVIANLVNGAQSENLGLKISSAYYLGEKKAESSVIPLMKILKSDEHDEARIVAALSLLKIGNEQGMYAVKQAIKFDDSPRVSRMCSIFYDMYLDQNKNK